MRLNDCRDQQNNRKELRESSHCRYGLPLGWTATSVTKVCSLIANFWHVPLSSWDETYRVFIPQVLNTSSTLAYYQVLQRFYAQLQDGHSDFYFPNQIYDGMARLPIHTRLIDGHMLVLNSYHLEADLKGLKPGDEVLSINEVRAVIWAEKTFADLIDLLLHIAKLGHTAAWLVPARRILTAHDLPIEEAASWLPSRREA